MNPDIDISNVTLRTERLTLRPWTPEDAQAMFEYASVDGVGQMAGWVPHKDADESREIIGNFIEGKKTFCVDISGKAVGSIGIEFYDEKLFPEFDDRKVREIGYVLSREYWGRGLMPEAVREVIRYCFEELGLDILLCGHFDWNRQSDRVQEKCGFRRYRTLDYVTRAGKHENAVMEILTREDWLKLDPSLKA